MGLNYPTALAKAFNKNNFESTPNDILGLAYIKAALKNNFNIKFDTIKRTNSFHDNTLKDSIVSASNIRQRYGENENIEAYMPKEYISSLKKIDYDKLFYILKTKILTDKDLGIYLDVDEGIENKLKKDIITVTNYKDLVFAIKNKRFTYNKINRMFIHILLGITKNDATSKLLYTKILGLSINGKKYLASIKKNVEIPILVDKNSTVYEYEIKAAMLYEILTNSKVYQFENSNKPIINNT